MWIMRDQLGALTASFRAPKDIAMSLKDTLMRDASQHHEGHLSPIGQGPSPSP